MSTTRMVDKSHINLFRAAFPVTSLGPGERIVIWVAGCRRRCPGCMSPEMQDPAIGQLVPIHKVTEFFLQLPVNISGITISGGEPFDQATPIALLLEVIRRKRPGWDVVIFSGMTMADLQKDDAKANLLSQVDILIDGAFQREVPQTHPLAGSGNQQVVAVSARGEEIKKVMAAMPFNRLNLGFGEGDETMIIGVTDESIRTTLKQSMQAKAFSNKPQEKEQ